VTTQRSTALQIEREVLHRQMEARKSRGDSEDVEKLYLQKQSELRHSEASFELREHSPSIEIRADVYVDKAMYKYVSPKY